MRRPTALVEGFAPDALALAAHLAEEGYDVRLAGPGGAPPAALALGARGVRVEPETDLDTDAELPHVAFLDVWTPEVAPRVARLRAGGSRVSSLSDLLLGGVAVPTVGVTGTAGKSTTATHLIGLLRAGGTVVHAGTTARPGQRWATEELIPLLGRAPADGVLVLELTSSHLAFCTRSPTVAVVTCVWPDHVELHGSLEAYVAAKQRIVRAQRRGDAVVVNADDPLASAFSSLTPGARWSFSVERPVERGAWAEAGTVVVATSEGVAELGPLPPDLGGRRQAAVAAAAAALATGARPTQLAAAWPALEALEPPPHRAAALGRLGAIELIDDSAAATARKAAATLRAWPRHSVVAVVGGRLESAGLAVQASPEERALVGEALDVLAGVAVLVVAFGPARARLVPALEQRGVPVEERESVDEALAHALAQARRLEARGEEVRALVVSPLFPLEQAERELVADRLRAAG